VYVYKNAGFNIIYSLVFELVNLNGQIKQPTLSFPCQYLQRDDAISKIPNMGSIDPQ
jgi:hypothetical protein